MHTTNLRIPVSKYCIVQLAPAGFINKSPFYKALHKAIQNCPAGAAAVHSRKETTPCSYKCGLISIFAYLHFYLS